MYINIVYKFHRIPDTQSHFITIVHDLLGQPSYILTFWVSGSNGNVILTKISFFACFSRYDIGLDKEILFA